MHHNDRAGIEILDDIVAVGNRVHAVAGGTVEIKQLGRVGAVERIRRPRESSGAERTEIHAGANVRQTLIVAFEHLHICAEMVCQRDRLCFLQMREARHNRIDVFLHQIMDRVEKAEEKCFCLIDLVANIELHIESDLVISGATGVKLLACCTDALGERRFDETVDVLGLLVKRKRSGLELRKDPLQLLTDGIAFLFRENSLTTEHRRMRDASADVLTEKSAVEAKRSVELVDQRIFLFGKTSSPEFHENLPSP